MFSALVARKELNTLRQAVASINNRCEYSVAGAQWQEEAIVACGSKTSLRRESLPLFVTLINNGMVSVEEATEKYMQFPG